MSSSFSTETQSFITKAFEYYGKADKSAHDIFKLRPDKGLVCPEMPLELANLIIENKHVNINNDNANYNEYVQFIQSNFTPEIINEITRFFNRIDRAKIQRSWEHRKGYIPPDPNSIYTPRFDQQPGFRD